MPTILDGAAIVNMLKPSTGKTFAAYAHDVFLPHLKRQLQQTLKGWTLAVTVESDKSSQCMMTGFCVTRV